ncbi:MAG: hypothetical protein B7Y45_03075 [Sphingomonas sp. 28-66-16]|nr:MAG: hypothetical protein B7Y45_03075 [Sphingomonas sp. 28-66-16]
MAVISPSSFDPVRRYVSVRLAQGVPLVDADWNESDDIRRFELRAFVRWFVGDGVPAGNDGFRVEAVAAPANKIDFRIKAGGDAAPLSAGRMFVDGLEAFILADTLFTAQPLHTSQPGAAALAARWGVPVIGAITAAATPLLIYLDVWERLVTPTEDATLILAGLGTESCSRLKREWAVRVRSAAGGFVVPKAGDADFLPGHSYAALARVDRSTVQEISAATLANARRTGLEMSSRRDLEQLIGDTFGTGYTTDGTGTRQLPYSIRDVLNGVLRDRPAVTASVTRFSGEPYNLPIGIAQGLANQLFWVHVNGPDRFLATGTVAADGTTTRPPDLFQFTGVLNVTSLAYQRLGSGIQRVFYTGQSGSSKLFSRRTDNSGVWQAPENSSSGADSDTGVSATLLANGSAQIAWIGISGGVPTQTIFTQNFPADGSAPGPIVAAGTVADTQARVVIVPGPQLIAFEQVGGNLQLETKTMNGGAWPGAWTPLATLPASAVRDLAAGFISPGRLWLTYALTAAGGTRLFGRTYEAGLLGEVRLIAPEATAPRYPNVVVAGGNASIFYQDGNALKQVSFVTQI